MVIHKVYFLVPLFVKDAVGNVNSSGIQYDEILTKVYHVTDSLFYANFLFKGQHAFAGARRKRFHLH